MKFPFDEPIPIVQEKKKYANFTVREIGGTTEIIAWRAQQKAKEDLYSLRLMSRDERVTNFEVETGTKLDRPKIHTTTWAEKQAFVKSERKRLAKIDDRVTETKYDFSEPKQSILQKISGFFKNIWKNANT